MKTKQIMVLLLLGVFAGFASAGNEGDYAVMLEIGNTGPTLDDVYMAAGNESATPVQNSTVVVYAEFDATDPNGNLDLDTSSAECNLQDGSVIYSGACDKTVIDDDSATFTCPITLIYYEPAGSYDLYCAIDDMAADGDNKLEYDQFTYNSLTAISIDLATLEFTTISVGESSGSSNDPIVVSNEGNNAIVNVSIASQDLMNIADDVLNAENFNASAADEIGTGAVMVENDYVEVPGVSITVGPSSKDSVYFTVAIPNAQPGGVYNTDTNWALLALA